MFADGIDAKCMNPSTLSKALEFWRIPKFLSCGYKWLQFAQSEWWTSQQVIMQNSMSAFILWWCLMITICLKQTRCSKKAYGTMTFTPWYTSWLIIHRWNTFHQWEKKTRNSNHLIRTLDKGLWSQWMGWSAYNCLYSNWILINVETENEYFVQKHYIKSPKGHKVLE